LGESPEVTEATQAYRDSQDVLHDFLSERCLSQPSATCFKVELYKNYEEWCNDGGDKYPLGKKTFNARITEKGFYGGDRGTNNKPMWRGLRLLTDDEKVTKVTLVTEKPQTILHEDNQLKLMVKMVTKVTKVTSADATVPKRLENLDPCPTCGSENIGVWPDGSAGYYCVDCFPNFNDEVE